MTCNIGKAVLLAAMVGQLVTRSAGQNPCQGMTLADCELGEDNIIATYPFETKACQDLCATSDGCQFWRDNKNETGNTCLHINTNYHKDCRSFAGPTTASIQDCLDVALETCGAIIEEECQYTGVRQEEFEPPAGDTSSIGDCQEWAAELAGAGLDVAYFHYYFPTEECRLYSSLEASCAAVGGPVQAPPVADCQGY